MTSVAKSLVGGALSIFKSPKAPKLPAPPPLPPRISSADAFGRAARGKLKRRKGLASTVLTFGLGKGTGTGSGATGTGGNILGGGT